jgi:hypothetical protein
MKNYLRKPPYRNIQWEKITIGTQLKRAPPKAAIRGGNILLMSRDGNRIIGDYNFTEDIWIKKLRNILAFHR